MTESSSLTSPSGRANRCRALVAVGVVCCLLSCRTAAPPAGPRGHSTGASAAIALDPKEVTLSPGLVLVTACTATGAELCFDATDNNCNGVIDEGCGVHTGLLQFAIAWEDGPDIDLRVSDPDGELARPGEETASGLHKDRDCGTKENPCHGQNLENVYFDGDSPPRGRYRVTIKVERANDARFPIKVRFGGRVGQHTYGMQLDIAAEDDEKVLLFTL